MIEKIEISPFNNSLIFKKGYTKSFVREVFEKYGATGLIVGDEIDPFDSHNFLKEYDFIKHLSLGYCKSQTFEFLEHLTNLKSLLISTTYNLKSDINLSNLTNLEELQICWKKDKIKGLGNCKNLKKLTLKEFKEKDLSAVKSLTKLEVLKVHVGSVKSLQGIENLKNLKELEIAYCAYLTDLSALRELNNLEKIEFMNLPKTTDFDSLSNIKSLSKLIISECRGIKSIKFTKNTPNLEELYILGNTNILDGDLTPGKRIKYFCCRVNRKHYNLKLDCNIKDVSLTEEEIKMAKILKEEFNKRRNK